MKPIALQLYSLRPEVYPAGSDMPSLLKTVADIGYRGVELAGLRGSDPKEVAKVLADLGLQACSSHTGLPTPENVNQIADTELTLGSKKAISGFGADAFTSLDACKEAADRFNQAGELLKPYGIQFGIHNHWWEFARVDGKYVYDVLMENNPKFFGELDVYWCAFGKADPVATVAKHKANLPLLHIKDGMLVEGNHVHTAVGSGKVGMAPIINAADPEVLKWLIVELDRCDTDMLQAVKDSYSYLTTQGLASGNK